ncbi:hypothetical protein BGW39_000376 [Mortierella sp. 14UC]|nr:hypothetical protein BGW39_000376 [Mortierella sp. 14UC]
MDRSRSPKKVSAAKWGNHFGNSDDDGGAVADVEGVGADGQEPTGSHAEGSRPSLETTGSSSRASSRRGFDNVGWRALEETYARDVLPHPYFHQDYLNITEYRSSCYQIERRSSFGIVLNQTAECPP